MFIHRPLKIKNMVIAAGIKLPVDITG